MKDGHINIGMKRFSKDDVVKPFTPVPPNRIRIADFLRYVADHQQDSNMEKYKEEYQVRSQFVATKQLFMIGAQHILL